MCDFCQRLVSKRLPATIQPLLLLSVAILAYGLLVPWLGFYWDDYPMAWIANRLGPQGLTRYFSTNRPFWGLLYQITTPLVGDQPLSWQLFALVWRWASAVAFWSLLNALWPRQPQAAAWASLFFLVYPGFRQQFVSLLYSHFFIVLTLFLLSLWSSLKAIRSERRSLAWHLLALLLAGYHLLAMEYFFLLELLRPLLISMVLADSPAECRSRLGRTLRHAWPYLLLFVVVTVWRLFFFRFQTQNYEMELFRDLSAYPLQAVANLLLNILQTFWQTIVLAWAGVFALPNLEIEGLRTVLMGILVMAISAVLLVGAFFLVRHDFEIEENRFSWAGPMWRLGLLAWLLGGGSVWLIGVVPRLAFPMDRFTLPFLFGASLLMAGLLAALPLRPILRWGILVLLMSLAVGRQFLVANEYRRAWVAQERFFWQMIWRMPALSPGTTIMMNQSQALAFYTDNSLTAPLNWFYAPQNTSQQMSLMMIQPARRLSESLPRLDPNLPILVDYLAADFQGSTSQVVAIYYEPPACLRVLRPGLDTESPLLSTLMRQAAALSDPRYILPEPPSGNQPILPDFYGSEPLHGWCYYFEKADLAAQKGDWERVVDLGEQAFALGDYPNDPLERVPFIEAYVYTGDWQQAYEQTLLAYEVSPSMNVPLCQLWQRLSADTPTSLDKDTALSKVIAELGCNDE